MPHSQSGIGQPSARQAAAFIGVAAILPRSLVIAFPLILLLGVVSWRGYHVEDELVREQLFTEAENSLDVQAKSIESQIMAVVRDAAFLASTTSMLRVLDSGTAQDRELLARQFLNAVTRKGYDQVRYLDAGGVEQVRVQLRLASPTVIPDKELQDKSGQFYVTAGLALARNEIYVSPLDLNVERGQLEQPLKPTYRVCTPVFDSRDARRGILVINVRAREMLDGLDAGSARGQRSIMLLDSEGYWLKSTDPADEWGFMFPDRRDLTFGARHPEAWEALRQGEQTRAVTGEGLYASRTVRIASSGAEAGPGVWVFQGQLPGRRGPPEMRLVALVPRDQVEQRLASLRSGALLSFSGAAAAILLFAAVLALTLERRKADQQALQALNARLQFQNLLMNAFSDASPDAIIVVDQMDRALYHNTRFLDMWGLRAEELDNTPCAEILAKVLPQARAPQAFAQRIRELNQNPAEQDFAEIALVDGRTLERSSVGLFGEGGAYLARAWFYRDVTARVRATEDLRQSQARLAAVLDTAVDGIVTINPAGRILTVNPAVERIFGWTRAEMEGGPVTRLMMEPYASQHAGYLKRYLESGVPRIIGQGGREVPGRRKDGSLVPLELAVSEVRVGETRLFTGILRDITERKQAQERIMAANAELESRQTRLDEDLAAAGAIQKSLLPQKLPEVGGGLEIDWLFEPSQRIGGDIFNIFALDRERLAVYILDVSGHGVPSALVAVSVSQALQPGSGVVTQGVPGGPAEIAPPAQVMGRLNREFPMERFDKFFTMAYLVLNHRTGQVEYCNAGHPPPLVVCADGAIARLEAGGMVVGMGDLASYQAGTVSLHDGDMLLLYTDGVTEYADATGELFGEERLESIARRMAGRRPDEALERIWASLMRFGQGAEPGDDVSMVCIRRCGR